MALCQLYCHSEILGRRISIQALVPEHQDGPFPAFYLLHGLSDDHTVWCRNTRIECYVRDLPLIVVMPNGERGFYTDNADGPRYATFMAEELPRLVERIFRARTDRAGRCVGGLSMGGYGALRLALGYPGRYVSASSHSGALLKGSSTETGSVLGEAEQRRIFGPAPRNTDHDLCALAERLAGSPEVPALHLDCGTEDFLLDENRAFHHKLQALGLPHVYREYPGGHTWDYWDKHIREALRFHCRALDIAAG